jgi:hypothetical protein
LREVTFALWGRGRMTPTCQFWWNWVVQALIALGTIGAVLAALFGNWFRAVLAPPKLSISLKNEIGVLEKAAFPDGKVTDSRWYHIRIENLRRWSPAREVQLLLLQFAEPDSAGHFQATWTTGDLPLQWKHQPIKPLRPTIGSPQDCDLCSVTKMPDGTHQLALHPLIRPLALSTAWGSPCKFAVTLQACSLETESTLLRVEIAWDGQWADDATQMSRHLVVKAAPTKGGRPVR